METLTQFDPVSTNEVISYLPSALLPPSAPLSQKVNMETAISAVIGELVSQFISFLRSKYGSNNAASEDQKMGRLEHLLLRVRTVVEEADGRHITNSGMVEQLQVLADAMYRGYRLLDENSFSCGGRPNNPLMEEVSNTSASAVLSFQSPPPKRCRTITFARKKAKAVSLDHQLSSSLDDTLDRLEAAAAHMAEFVVLLGGCERLSRRPYDAHLYIDNFMFGRHAEKQRLLNFLLHQNSSAGSPPPVLSVIGGLSVGKKTLVAHVCSDERVTSHFSLILHLDERDLVRVEEHERRAEGKVVLIVVEFDSVVDEEDWVKFYSSVTNMKKGSKVVIISKLRNFETFATVKPIFLKTLPYEEFRYLFKVLAFGSADPMEYPQLLRIVDELSKVLQLGWTLVTANATGEFLRTNLDVRFWLGMLNRATRITERNMSVLGAYPKALAERGHHVDMTDLELTPGAPFHLAWGTTKAHDDSVKKELPKVTIGELMIDPTARPKGEFNMIIWQSRIPPHTCFGHFVPNCDQGMRQHVLLSGRKRRGVP